MKTSEYYKELDGVRGLAALMVMFFHFFKQSFNSNNFLLDSIVKFSVFGQTGVTLFFVLSGFLITRILIHSKSSTNFFTSFYVRRSLRIFPLYYLYLSLLLIYTLFEYEFSQPAFEQFYFWTYLQNFAYTFNWSINGPHHFWSLSVEEHFYLFWPLFVYYSSNKTLMRTSILLCCVAALSRYVLLRNGYDAFYFTLTNLDSLAIGAILALVQIEFTNRLDNSKTRDYSKIFLLGAIVVIIPTLALWTLVGGKALIIVQVVKPILLNLFYFFFIGYIMFSEQNVLKTIFKSAPLAYCGKISYGIYVYHRVCFISVSNFSPFDSVIVRLILSFTLCFAVASASYFLFEKRFLNLKRHFKYRQPLKQHRRSEKVSLSVVEN